MSVNKRRPEQMGHPGKSGKRTARILILSGLIAMLLSGCSLTQTQSDTSQAELTGPIMDEPGTYDSADTAIITAIDQTAKTITLYNPEHDKSYTLTYSGISCFYDKYGNGISSTQLQAGEIVDLTFYKAGKRLNTMQRSPDAWNYAEWTNFEINSYGNQISIGSALYTLPANVKVLSLGEEITLEDLDAQDQVSIYGMDSKVYSIVVERGHGYLRLENDTFFYDGWIEVGTKVISKVEENMLLTVPEGTQNVVISNKGVSGTKTVHIERGKEVTLDVGDLQGEISESGTVIFTISPSDAYLYIDGEKADASKPVTLSYGIHQLIIRAEGYQTVTQYLNVGQASAGVDIELQKKEMDTEESSESTENSDVSGNDTSGTTTDTISTTSYYVSITAPSDVEVYLDGNYVGLSPCEFKKEAGLHTILLRKSGYQSKTYTVQIDEDAKNITYSFPDLIAE
ncbi:MAG: PEGA domain-containing protein [Lachnospiraceae bacterium]|nr:PEGA domain-containing protein [Lachnospiraceae bacterium]